MPPDHDGFIIFTFHCILSDGLNAILLNTLPGLCMNCVHEIIINYYNYVLSILLTRELISLLNPKFCSNFKEKVKRIITSKSINKYIYFLQTYFFKQYFLYQVLNMAVDDADLQLDFSPNNHAFNIHSVQYLSKDNGKF